MSFRVTYFFEMGTFGWSESFYHAGTTLAAVEPEALDLGSKRLQFLPIQAKMTFIRISDPAIRGDSSIYPGFGNGTASWTEGPAFPWSSILVRLDTTDPSVRGRVFTRPAPEITGTGFVPTSTIPGFWLTQSSAWRAALTSSFTAWSVRGLAPENTDKEVVGKPSITGGTLSLETLTASGLVVGNKFRLMRAKGIVPCPCCLNGVYRVSEIGPGNLVRALTDRADCEGKADTGVVRKLSYDLFPIATATPLRNVSHRTGRPFDSPRGKRSRRTACC